MPDDPDLIVVGAGTAGSVIAARASQAGVRVLLLEAGPDYPDPAALPDDLADGNNNSYVAHDWGFSYRPREQNNPTAFPRGRVVGGSSAVNTCIALRGEPADYDEWASIAGPEWAWDKCLPAFVRLESDRDFGDAAYHGSDGPLPIGRYAASELVPIQAAFLEACASLGLPECPDLNAPGSEGFGPTPLNKIGSRRVSLAEAYLAGARSRPNLEIRPGTLVHRVTFRDGSVTGVDTGNGSIECANVVLCAGSITTPPILVRSGIGPKQTLARLGIPEVAASEGVGARLFDHPATALILSCEAPPSGRRVPLMQTCMRLTVNEPRDLFVEAMSFLGRPEMAAVGIAVSAYRSYSVGRLDVTSADPSAAPTIDCRFYDDGHDVDLMVAGLRLALRLAATPAISAITTGTVGVSPDEADDDQKLREHVLRFVASGFHPCGTAPMGSGDDPLAVCDQYGRVFGVSGLRVADASIMPSVPRANTNIPTAMIGERFGEWLASELAS